MDALYLFRHSKNSDFEIRYSLRSLARHAPYLRKIWIFGDKPEFLTENTSLIEHVPHAATARIFPGVRLPVTNFFLHLFFASLIPELSSEFIWLADDYFLLKDFPIDMARKDRYLENLATKEKSRGTGLWKDSLWRTYDVLKRLGYPGYNFEVHVPTYLTKKRIIDAYSDFKDFVTQDRWYGLLGPSAILNHALKHEKMPLVQLREEDSRCGFWGKQPTHEEVLQAVQGKTFLNFDDEAYGEGLHKFLTELFPTPCHFEKESA